MTDLEKQHAINLLDVIMGWFMAGFLSAFCLAILIVVFWNIYQAWKNLRKANGGR